MLLIMNPPTKLRLFKTDELTPKTTEEGEEHSRWERQHRSKAVLIPKPGSATYQWQHQNGISKMCSSPYTPILLQQQDLQPFILDFNLLYHYYTEILDLTALDQRPQLMNNTKILHVS